MNKNELINQAIKARENAYVPYSKFKVGAALVTESGQLYLGSNIENSAYPVTCCAERVALFKAISEGERQFKAMAIVADTKAPVSPCGSCRQVMSEFFNNHVQIHLTNLHGDIDTTTIEVLLPAAFQPKDVL